MKKYAVALGFIFGAALGLLISLLIDFSLVVGFAGGASVGLIIGSMLSLYEKSKTNK